VSEIVSLTLFLFNMNTLERFEEFRRTYNDIYDDTPEQVYFNQIFSFMKYEDKIFKNEFEDQILIQYSDFM
jgi:hypothetical protein